ncbi:hypothetical protein KZ287_27755, partial [Escherichia coli]|nr:hypothetical protein [Escherichia coli]
MTPLLIEFLLMNIDVPIPQVIEKNNFRDRHTPLHVGEALISDPQRQRTFDLGAVAARQTLMRILESQRFAEAFTP